MQKYSVSQVNDFIRNILAAEEILYGISIYGEITNFVHHGRSGHFYFNIKDGQSTLKCVMFENNASKVPFVPEDGMQVLLRGDLRVYHRDGVYQLYCISMQQEGVGEQAISFEEIKNRLLAEDLFDEKKKRPLPKIPETVGVITSKSGAALQDILRVFQRRLPMAEIRLFPAQVQGEGAPKSILQALSKASKDKDLDILILGRGGGAKDDLGAFNNEDVVRAVASFPVPVISAIGHEVDSTLTDFAADLRAATPTAAAELATPLDNDTLRKNIDKICKILYNCINSKLEEGENFLKWRSQSLRSFSPQRMIQRQDKKVKAVFYRIQKEVSRLFEEKDRKLLSRLEMLDSLSPSRVLKRGYSVTFNGSCAIRCVDEVKNGDTIRTKLTDGTIYSSVTEIQKGE